MTSNIFIPKRLKVGFNERSDTYSKKLAYVIYWDDKGKLRKQDSWEHWRDKDIEPYLLMLKSMVDACDYSPVSSTSCIMSGFTLEDWYNDFVSKYNSLKYAEDAAELAKLEKKLDNMLSNDKKIELEIEEISKLLGD